MNDVKNKEILNCLDTDTDTAESPVLEKDVGDDGDYELYHKEALIALLIEKDKLILQKTDHVIKLEKDLKVLKESNQHFQDELANLNLEVQKYRNESLVHQLNRNNTVGSVIAPQEESEREYGEKPMPDWTDTTINDLTSSISDAVRATAEAELKSLEYEQDSNCKTSEEDKCDQNKETNSDYVYDPSSGYYYHPSTGYYWDPNSGLFYDYTSGTYFQYNETSGEYKVHSQIDTQASNTSCQDTKMKKDLSSALNKSSCVQTHSVLKRKRSLKKKMKDKTLRKSEKLSRRSRAQQDGSEEKNYDWCKGKERKARSDQLRFNCEDESSDSVGTDESELVSDPESGEIISSSSSDVEMIGDDVVMIGDEMLCDRTADCEDIYVLEKQHIEAMADNYPPCIRVIVEESEKLCAGTLFIVTYIGGTIGRDTAAKHVIEIPDIGVSKNHASFEYDYEQSCYIVRDLGSQNGTRVNGERLNQSQGGGYAITHGDVLHVGSSTKLLLHIHKGHETCENCEPGQIQAKLKALSSVKNTHTVMTMAERKQQQKKELKNIKKKYGLQNSYFENEGAVPKDPDYTDKAYLRRRYIGSENESSVVDRPASVHNPIAPSNKGHKLLAKMGWKEGQGLGKTSAGIAEPINVELRVNQNAGLGSSAGHSLSLDRVQDSNKAKRWTQARQRFNQLPPTSHPLKGNNAQVSLMDHNADLQTSSTDKPFGASSNITSVPVPSTIVKSLKTNVSKPQISWHKGGTEVLSNNVSDNKDS